MTFTQWLSAVDTELYRRVGLSHDDLEDWLWHDAFEEGCSPKDAVEDFLSEVLEG